ncbi:hypothetical protein Scep_022313 [Stephania cephalantha]|uniref:Uncharacterized protein n=1 Tax=Stephania cephalantha TaxID=152367 RepID=A0AAP0F5X8_9MAGN
MARSLALAALLPRLSDDNTSSFISGFSWKPEVKDLKLSSGFKTRARAALNSGVKDADIPRQWYNLVADLAVKPPPPLHPKTLKPVVPEDLSPLFPDELIMQEASNERFMIFQMKLLTSISSGALLH